jgi:hypothetical protein
LLDGPVFDRFANKSPTAVNAAILLARVFSPEKLDDLFERVSGGLLYAGSAFFDRIRFDE